MTKKMFLALAAVMLVGGAGFWAWRGSKLLRSGPAPGPAADVAKRIKPLGRSGWESFGKPNVMTILSLAGIDPARFVRAKYRSNGKRGYVDVWTELWRKDNSQPVILCVFQSTVGPNHPFTIAIAGPTLKHPNMAVTIGHSMMVTPFRRVLSSAFLRTLRTDGIAEGGSILVGPGGTLALWTEAWFRTGTGVSSVSPVAPGADPFMHLPPQAPRCDGVLAVYAREFPGRALLVPAWSEGKLIFRRQRREANPRPASKGSK